MAAKRTPLTGFMPTPTSRPAADAEDDVDRELAKAVKAFRQSSMFRWMGAPMSGGDSVPPPSTSKELIDLTRETASTTKAVADLHKEAAEAERARRLEAEQRVAGSYAAGEADAKEKYEFFAELQAQQHQQTVELLKELSQQRLEAAQQQYAAQLTALEQKLTLQLQQIQSDLARTQAEKEGAVARVQAEAERDKELLKMQHGQELLKIQHEHELNQARAQAGSPLAQAQQRYYETYYQTVAEVHAEKLRDEVETLKAKRAKEAKQLELYDWLKGKGDEVLGLLGKGVTMGLNGGATGLPRNGLPARPPEVGEEAPRA